MTVLKGFDFSKPDNIKNAESNEETEHFYRYVKAGETISVGLLKPSEYAQVEVYDVYPITQTVGIPQEDLFLKTKTEMFNLADKAKAEALGMSEKEATEAYKKMAPDEKEAFKKGKGAIWYYLLVQGYRFDKQVRFLFAFYDFNTGSPFVIQTTKKQAEGIYKKISAAWTPASEGAVPQAEMFAYTISKGTGGFTVDVDTNKMIVTMSPEEQTKHKELRSQVIPEQEFDNAHFVLSVDAQKEAIKTFAKEHPDLDLSKIFEDVAEKEPETEDIFSRNEGQPLDISDDDLPF